MGKENKAGWFVLLAKLGPKAFAVALKMLKAVKFGKFGFAAATAVSYAYLFTWQFAAAIMVALFVHESGHVWAMKRCGMQVKGIYFIPFLGAAAVTEGSFKSRWGEAFIALAGPVWGMAFAIGAAIVYEATGEPIWAALASWMAMLNLFNLLPVNPLDGGRVMKSVAFSVHSKLGFALLAIGIALSVVAAFLAKSVLFGMLAVIGAAELWMERKRERNELNAEADRIGMPREALDEILREGEALKSMSKLELAVTVVGYLIVASTLFYVMDVMKHEPGAELARQVLVDE